MLHHINHIMLHDIILLCYVVVLYDVAVDNNKIILDYS